VRSGRAEVAFLGMLGLGLAAGLLDQTPGGSMVPDGQAPRVFAHDAAFVRRLEASLPPASMIFQLPYMALPEHGTVEDLGDYELLRPFLHSKTLRWSYGAMRGRQGDYWQRDVAAKPPADMVRTLAFAGFAGIYIDRSGFADRAEELEEELRGLLGAGPLVSPDGRKAFFALAAYSARLRDGYTSAQWEHGRERALNPVYLTWTNGFSAQLGPLAHPWRFCGPQGDMRIHNNSASTVTVRLTMAFRTGQREPAWLRLRGKLLSAECTVSACDGELDQTVAVPPGTHAVRFECDAGPSSRPGDPRGLVFKVLDWRVEEVPCEGAMPRDVVRKGHAATPVRTPALRVPPARGSVP
jgi:phosphoglycerol transferase